MRLIEQNQNYMVDEFGNIYSRPRVGTKGGLVKLMTSSTGYRTVMLGSDRRPIKVHRLVALAFIPNPDNKPFVNHKDGDKTNNHVDNLEWCTASENAKHAYDNGLIRVQRGEDRSDAKLTEDDVKYIRQNYIGYDRVYGTRGLARRFSVNKSTILRVLTGNGWSHVTT